MEYIIYTYIFIEHYNALQPPDEEVLQSIDGA